jgi:hypothetical protein
MSALLVAALSPAAAAKDPRRWTEAPLSRITLEYFQGIASDPAGRIFFDGVRTGLYRTDPALRETARNSNVIPPSVSQSEFYNHVGDIAWDAREGGRVLLPLECFNENSMPGTEDPGNCSGRGAVGVADPETLQWRYHVNLDPAEIPKVSWHAVSEDGRLLWTHSRDDLLAYSLDDISAANASPAGPIRAVKVLRGRSPLRNINGGAFFRGRLYVAAQTGALFQVFSVDVDTGARRLEIERQINGESEGVDFFPGLGGVLHWMIMPNSRTGPPTYGGGGTGVLLHFFPRGEAPPGMRPRIRVSVKPKTVNADKRVRYRFTATWRFGETTEPVANALIRFDGKRLRTDSEGRASKRRRIEEPGRHKAKATAAGFRGGEATVRVRPRR